MDSLLNPDRPPVFCPGCSHERSLKALDQAFRHMRLARDKIVMVSDIGCSGLFDTFFNTHAFHGLHGRALTYATGIKLSRPDLKVVVTMGDGGLGIGGAHLLAACRRNLDLTLLVLNNFNFGMTGGQYSCTTPADASTPSAFLSQIEKPMDICTVAAAAGAPFVARASAHRQGLVDLVERAITFEGFSIVDIWGICTGRYLKNNPLNPAGIDAVLHSLPPCSGLVTANERPEYGKQHRQKRGLPATGESWTPVKSAFSPSIDAQRQVVLLGSAGQKIISAGFILATAALSAGLQVTQKNEYNITVMRGPSVTELIISPDLIDYTGIEQPAALVCLSQEGVGKRLDLFRKTSTHCRVIKAADVRIPPSHGAILEIDFKALGIKPNERALAAIALLAKANDPITLAMLETALKNSLKAAQFQDTMGLIARGLALK
ncbi:MAG: 2-oxoglutarate synthase [Desulfatitalea sp.]|nr:2-oxoacid:acceptor oxidoreductase family protein [Desulfatitalea sp.]NNK01136.1 2-oxoglutarate synthase [Desulfatitalea sp.]